VSPRSRGTTVDGNSSCPFSPFNLCYWDGLLIMCVRWGGESSSCAAQLKKNGDTDSFASLSGVDFVEMATLN